MPPKLKNNPSRPADKDYLKFLSSLRLIGLRLKSSSTSIDRKLFFELLEAEKPDKPLRSLSEMYETTNVGKDCFDAEGRYHVTIADGTKVALKIECVFAVHMHAPPPVDSQMAQRFSKSDLRFVLLPFARQFVSGITSQMEIPPIVLPLAAAAGKARVAKVHEEG
jgi:hypothetical protein